MQVHEELTPSAEQIRVTPEEFASAVARIEARKDADQHHAAGTIAIGDAVRQLGLDASAEEVLAEVETLRADQRQGEIKVGNSQSTTRTYLFLSLFLCFVMLGPFLGWLSELPHHLQPDPAHLQVGDASGQVKLLSEVGDNQVVYSQLNMIGASLEDYSPHGKPWMLIKHDGHFYLRGWIGKVSPQALRSKGLDVSNQPQPGYDTPITLPLDGFKVAQETGPYPAANFHADDVHLDSHAWEKW